MCNEDGIWNLFRRFPGQDGLELGWFYRVVRIGWVAVGFRGGLEEGIVVKLAGRAGEIAGSYEQKYKESKEENDLPRRWRRKKRSRGRAAHGG